MNTEKYLRPAEFDQIRILVKQRNHKHTLLRITETAEIYFPFLQHNCITTICKYIGMHMKKYYTQFSKFI